MTAAGEKKSAEKVKVDEEDDNGRELVIDKGYSWIVLVAVSFMTFLEMGNFKTFGIYFVTFLDEFKATATMTSLISAIYCLGFSFFVLPVETVMVDRFSCRAILWVGGLSTSLALIISSFAKNIFTLFFSNGILLAFGSACIHGPSMIILGRYFDKRRGLTNSIAISFGSLGGLVQPILFTIMMTEYDLRGALLLQGAILFNCVLGATLARPLPLSVSFAKYDNRIRQKRKYALNSMECVNNDKDIQIELLEKREDNLKVCSNGHINEISERVFELSTTNIAQFSSAFDLYSVSMADISHDVVDSKKAHNTKKSICANFIDFSIMKNKMVLLFALVFCLASVASCSAYLFVPPHAKDRGIPEREVSIIASMISVSEVCGRIVLAFVADTKYLQRYKIIVIALFMNGIVLQFSWFLDSFAAFIGFTIAYGIFSGALISLYAPVCVDFIGVDKFHKAMGVLHMGQGIMVGIAGFGIGLMRDYTGSYVAGFHVMGGCGFVAGILLIFVPKLRSKEPE